VAAVHEHVVAPRLRRQGAALGGFIALGVAYNHDETQRERQTAREHRSEATSRVTCKRTSRAERPPAESQSEPAAGSSWRTLTVACLVVGLLFVLWLRSLFRSLTGSLIGRRY
jgi:hypothetical protein